MHLITLILFLSFIPYVMQSADPQVYTPEKGSPERKAILDAVRQKLKISNQFEVQHLKADQRWAFFTGNALVIIDGEKVETDSIQALLEKRTIGGKHSWVVVELWNLEQSGTEAGAKRFAERVRQRQKAERIEKAILPDDL